MDRDEILEVMDDITTSVASRLAIHVNEAESRREAHYPSDMRVYGLVLRSQRLLLRFTKEATAHARHLLDEAIELAPGYARAHASLSRTHNLDWRYCWSSVPKLSLATAVNLALRPSNSIRLMLGHLLNWASLIYTASSTTRPWQTTSAQPHSIPTTRI